MNNIIKQACLLCLLLLVVSCNKDPEYYTLETPADQMFLKASATDITLGKDKEQEVAVTFTWNEAASRGTDTNITYFFKMWMSELSSNVTELYEIPSGERSISFTHGELNDILTEWGMGSGDKVTIEAEVIAQINSSEQYLKPELSKTKLNVNGYDKNISAIYMVMLSNDGERNVRQITQSEEGTGVFRATVELGVCQYYFTLSADSDYPAYVKGEEENTLKYVSEAGDYEMFENNYPASYTLEVNLDEMTIDCTIKNIAAIYMVMGSGSSQKRVKMTEKVEGSNIYQATTDLTACEYYFAFSATADYPAYVKGESDNTLKYAQEAGDYEMFENTLSGESCLVMVDLNEDKMDVRILSKLYPLPNNGIWVIGAACPNIMWELTNMEKYGALVSEDPRYPEIWKYTGDFVVENFKLFLQSSWSWEVVNFFAPTADANPATEHRLCAETQRVNGDLKWKVAQKGKYTLVVDISKMTIDLVSAEE